MSENDHKYHKPADSDIPDIQRIREKVIELENLFEEVCQADARSLAVAKTNLETARMWAIKAVVMRRPVDPNG